MSSSVVDCDGEIDGNFRESVGFRKRISGIEANVLAFDKQLRPILWGHARVSSNWHLIKAFGIGSHRAALEGQRFLELFRGIWNCGAHERLRTRLLASWNSFLLPRGTGLWHSWLQQLATLRAKLVPDGGVEVPWFPRWVAHLNQSKQAWMHNARILWRAHWARSGIQHLFPEARHHSPWIDWDCVGAMTKTRSTMAATVFTNGLNTRARSALHFHDDCAPDCEHLCGVPDTFRHRCVDCVGSQLRRQLLLNNTRSRWFLLKVICPSTTSPFLRLMRRQWRPGLTIGHFRPNSLVSWMNSRLVTPLLPTQPYSLKASPATVGLVERRTGRPAEFFF